MVSSSPTDCVHDDDGHGSGHREAITFKQAVALAAELKAVAEPNRLRLLSLIATHERNEACVCDLVEPLGLTQPTVSHHLKVLVAAGFLSRSTRGSWSVYSLVPGAMDGLTDRLRSSIDDQQWPTETSAIA